METTRRQFFALWAALPFTGWLLGRLPYKFSLPPTPECDDHDDPTPPQTEGPYFTPHSPERTNLRDAGITGTGLVLTGQVLNTKCQPVAKALLDWWHCDEAGQYDNQGFRLRGHQYTDDKGLFRLETIVPGVYPGRTRHIHVKVQALGRAILTTQLYFPDEPQNQHDGIFNKKLLLTTDRLTDQVNASFTFVLKA